jgi:hypothetical protein
MLLSQFATLVASILFLRPGDAFLCRYRVSRFEFSVMTASHPTSAPSSNSNNFVDPNTQSNYGLNRLRQAEGLQPHAPVMRPGFANSVPTSSPSLPSPLVVGASAQAQNTHAQNTYHLQYLRQAEGRQ